MGFVEIPTDRRRGEMQTDATEQLGNLDLAHGRAEDLEPTDDVGNEVGKLVDGLSHPDDRVRSLFVQTSGPRGDGCRGDQETAGGLCGVPAACGTKLEDGESLGWEIMGASLGRDPQHAGALDPHLFGQQRDFLTQAVVLLLESDSCVAVVGGPAACIDDRELRDGDGMHDGRANSFGPALGQRKTGRLPVVEHRNPSNGKPLILDEGPT